MSPKRQLRDLFGKKGKPLGQQNSVAKFDQSYPDHINTWASKLKNSVEGLRDDSEDLQKKYEGAPLRRRPKANKKAKKPKVK